MADDPGTETSAEPAIKTVTMTADELEQLLANVAREAAAAGGFELPPGAYREGGRVYRDVYVPAPGRLNPETGEPEQGMRTVRRPVYLVTDTSPRGLAAAQDEAYLSVPQQDVYHPDYGWLRFGRKREVEVEANLGSDHDTSDVTYAPIADANPRVGIPLPPAPSPAPKNAKR
jgi:hypothetical protein